MKCEVIIISSFYETKPFGIKKQNDFVNAVIKIDTDYNPFELFEFLKQAEKELGRTETIRWGPREIDLDILLYNDLIYSDENLTIPHKGILERDFVIIPLCEIEPDLIHPTANKKISEINLHINQSNVFHKFPADILIK